MNAYSYLRQIVKDILILVGSILLAVFLVKGNILHTFIEADSDSKILSSILAGSFFTSFFTLAPATVGLVAISKSSSPHFVAFFAAIGAMTIDLLIAAFIRKDISEDLNNLKKFAIKRHFIRAFHFGFLKWIAFVFGMFLIVTPLPDELGLVLIGLSKVKSWTLPIIFYLAHFGGIYLLLTIAEKI